MIRTNFLSTSALSCDHSGGCSMLALSRPGETGKKLRARMQTLGWARAGDGSDRCPAHAIQPLKLGNTTLTRIAAALSLPVRPVRAGIYSVGEHRWTVDLSDAERPRCGCPDHMIRGMLCKHIVAALLSLAPAEARAEVVRSLNDQERAA